MNNVRTQREAALQKVITREMELVALEEHVSIEEVRSKLAAGTACLPANNRHELRSPRIIGSGFTVKINANIGTSPDLNDEKMEIDKAKTSVDTGADAVMDLSTGGDIRTIRRKVREVCPVPLGTVPIYEAMAELIQANKPLQELTADHLFEVIERHGEDGVDFITVHCGVTTHALERLNHQGRITRIVSRGGSLLAQWMVKNKRENPLYEQYDRLLEIARNYDMTLSLGDGLRPGCLADATDRAQIEELITLGELTDRAWKAGVQVMIEGPGHVPMNQIETNMRIQKTLCKGAPFYVLGPLVTDIAPGYDHITSAIGGALAAWAGADFLCYVTPAEHLRLPTLQDVREGVVASRIAAHAADIARGNARAFEQDRKMAVARRNLDWEAQIRCAIDPEKASQIRRSAPPADKDVCSMCGKFCAIKGWQDAVED
ncbi:phosphomethylpyrimidine synthase ThiC [bacterium]|nr:phosphomethylpyrimidine synthase ThiC [candidate division CSSED10-310 bacterium]